MSDNSDTDNTKLTFLQRWSQHKQQQGEKAEYPDSQNAAPDSTPVTRDNATSEQELPSVDSLDENSEVSMFFSEGVSETIKRQALRKLFHMKKFNVCDGLDDYAEDYTGFQSLGDVVTAHQRLSEKKEKLRQAVLDDRHAPAAASSDGDTIETPVS
jgi:hypothetical protein